MIIWTDGSITLFQYLFLYPNNVKGHLSYFKMHYDCVPNSHFAQYYTKWDFLYRFLWIL